MITNTQNAATIFRYDYHVIEQKAHSEHGEENMNIPGTDIS
jgi:hypothetical protein